MHTTSRVYPERHRPIFGLPSNRELIFNTLKENKNYVFESNYPRSDGIGTDP